ncbi:dynamin family protein [Ideonella dechloratans]|uniref:dynamin family protein n=1 Tax=Ideonella dechloratans TaxID=36863 RepID=UPI0035B3DFC6
MSPSDDSSLNDALALQPALEPQLDALADWRLALERELVGLEAFLAQSDLLSPSAASASHAVRHRLATDKLVVAFVAEFSRGKSELINAIFFADAGRRILPATPGRTTMCPVELSWDPAELPTLDLLPIETRRQDKTLAEWSVQRDRWYRIPLDPSDPDGLAISLQQVTQTRSVSREDAQRLGLWSEEHPQDNPPTLPDGQVEIPAWRHAVINYPHPLLQRGLVVIDTPGLNAIGTEPELTLGLLPSAHAALFVLAADTGVTRSDLDIWNDHLGGQGLSCFVVLNKVDTLADPLASPEEQRAAVERQCETTAQTLGIVRDRVFPISARQALAARLQGDVEALQASGLPALEAALNLHLLPQRQRVLAKAVIGGVQSMLEHATRALRDQRRQNAEQMLELRGLRGKSASRVAQMLDRVTADTAEFERCTARLTALRAVHARLQHKTLKALDADRIREAMAQLEAALGSGWLHLRARGAFAKMCAGLQAQLDTAASLNAEAAQMLQALFSQLNAEFGFSLNFTPAPDVSRFKNELSLIERNYGRYFNLSSALRLNSTVSSEQFHRMLVSKLRVVFENASAEIESWHQNASGQVDGQFRDRRRGFRRRRESLERIQHATGELEARLAEVETQDNKLLELADQAQAMAARLRQRAEAGPDYQDEALSDMGALDLDLSEGEFVHSDQGLFRPGAAA